MTVPSIIITLLLLSVPFLIVLSIVLRVRRNKPWERLISETRSAFDRVNLDPGPRHFLAYKGSISIEVEDKLDYVSISVQWEKSKSLPEILFTSRQPFTTSIIGELTATSLSGERLDGQPVRTSNECLARLLKSPRSNVDLDTFLSEGQIQSLSSIVEHCVGMSLRDNTLQIGAKNIESSQPLLICGLHFAQGCEEQHL